MHTYDFQTKVCAHVFDNIKWVVNNNCYVKFTCPKEECTIIEMDFEEKTLMVGYPIERLGKVTIGGWISHDPTTGWFFTKIGKVYFTIYGEILYLRRTYK